MPSFTLKEVSERYSHCYFQLYEARKVRRRRILLICSDSSKKNCIELLLKTFFEVDKVKRGARMNLKAITASEMFGLLEIANDD
ncbi:Dynein heavy chain 5 axonemal [Taenia solium]|eukprot:TsM_000279400 transcript=TsM_000279400 gene=TsM_000279400